MNNIVDELLSIAFEAEDITKETKKQNDRVDEGAPERRTSGIDTDTNDILGTKEVNQDNDEPDDNTEEDDSMDDGEDDPDATDETDDADPEDDGSGMDDTDGSDTDASTDDQMPPEEMSNVKKKIILKKNIILLYNIIKGNIESLSKYNPDNVDNDLYDKFYKIQKHLMNCKDILFELGTDEIDTSPYLVSLKKYVSVKQVYDICILMLDRFYDAIKIDNGLKEDKNKNEDMRKG